MALPAMSFCGIIMGRKDTNIGTKLLTLPAIGM